MRLSRPARPPMGISLVPLVDVFLILLIFFIVTSTFLDLNMIPLVSADEAVSDGTPQTGASTLLRLTPEGAVRNARAILSDSELTDVLRTGRVFLIASPAADTQSLVRVLDIAARVDGADLQLVRFR